MDGPGFFAKFFAGKVVALPLCGTDLSMILHKDATKTRGLSTASKNKEKPQANVRNFVKTRFKKKHIKYFNTYKNYAWIASI